MIGKENLENLIPKVQPAVEGQPIVKVEQQAEVMPTIKGPEQANQTIPVQQTQITPAVNPPISPAVKDPLAEQIENILEDGLSEAYLSLSAEKKQEFKMVGEATAKKITLLLQEAKVKISQIFLLIIRWLKVIPGVNKFFLEQEAKIKTDRIIKLNQQ